MELQRFKAACALVESPGESGTGYLVAADLVATCAHVVARAAEGDVVRVRFEGQGEARTGRVVQRDDDLDSALVRLDGPATGIEPLPLVASCAPSDLWQAFGYPRAARGDGSVFAGRVDDPQARKGGHPALQLFSEAAAAGLATPLHGLSGSPVAVGAGVAGHIREVRSDPEHPGQPAFGQIFASPASSVLALLARTGAPAAAVPAAPAVAPAPAAPPPPPLGPGEYHAFVSYRSTDHAFARELVERLEGNGLRVFLDQKELVPGDDLPGALQLALGRSRAALLLVSRGWLESAWCQAEASALVVRSVQEGIRIVPLRLDDSPLPAFLAGRVWLDFSRAGRPVGEELNRLLAALGATPAAAPAAALPAARAADEVRWQNLEEARRSPAAALLGAQALVDLGEPAAALDLLRGAGDGTRAVQLRALCLARTGKKQQAIELLEPLYRSGQIDAETGGILAGRYKQLWLERRQPNLLDQSLRVYLRTWLVTGDVYPGVNALAMALWLEREQPGQLAPEDRARIDGERPRVRERCLRIDPDEADPWRLATRAEMHLLDREIPDARRFYGLAASRQGTGYQNVAVMRRQARLDLRYLGEAEGELEALLPVPGVVAFTGHMTDAPDRPAPRFPDAKVPAVRAAIRDHLQRQRAGFGYGSAARGSDLLFVEELVALGGKANVFLPFPAEDFKTTSVGYGWNARFDAVLKDERVHVTVLAPRVPADEAGRNEAYAACNAEVQRAARAQAELLDQRPRLLAVWNGRPGDGPGGASSAVEEWRRAGLGEPDVVDLSGL